MRRGGGGGVVKVVWELLGSGVWQICSAEPAVPICNSPNFPSLRLDVECQRADRVRIVTLY